MPRLHVPPSKNGARIGVVLVVLLLLTPVSFAALTKDTAAVSQNSDLRKNAKNVTFVSTQGGSTHIYEHAGALVAVHTDSKQILWKHDAYRRYMDIDPIGSDRILFVAGERTGKGGFRRVAVVANWRTGDELVKFQVPPDTHDIDHLGNDRYAIADKRNDRAYVYDAKTKNIVWEYDFEKHFSPSVGGPEKDYTHLNDIDSVDNGSAFLLSPRNFDRVMLVDRESKQIEWTLGAEDDYDTLYEQHNPVLLEQNPPTILVSDSENHRIVEYRRQDGDWKRTWVYRGHLHWPRDADRLPNGNTLIADSLNDRVLEVTPDRKVVWQFHIERGTYDVERLRYGDEPAGPTMASQGHRYDELDSKVGSTDSTWTVLFKLDSSYRKTFQILTWVLPSWVTLKEYGFLLSATLLFVGWMFTEAVSLVPNRLRRRRPSWERPLRHATHLAATLTLVVGVTLVALIPVATNRTTIYAGLGALLVIRGVGTVREHGVFRRLPDTVGRAIDGGLATAGLLAASVLVSLAVVRGGKVLLYLGIGVAILTVTIPFFERLHRDRSWNPPVRHATRFTGMLAFVVGVGLLALVPVAGRFVHLYAGIGVLLLDRGFVSLRANGEQRVVPAQVVLALKTGLLAVTVPVAIALLLLSVRTPDSAIVYVGLGSLLTIAVRELL